MLIEDGFDLLPTLPGTASTAVILNEGGTGFTTTTGALALAGNFTTTGAFNTTLIQQATVSLTLPPTSGTLLLTTGSGASLTGITAGQISGLASVATSGSASDLSTGTLPAARMSGSYTGITGVGTLTAGVWNGTIITSAYGGTGNGFTKFSGPTTTERTFTLPDASATILTAASSSTVSVGYPVTAYNGGTVSSGTFTATATNAGLQYYTNNGAHTLAAPSSDCTILILITNGASAGTITFSGFTVSSSTGDTLTTVNAARFVISIVRVNSISTYLIKAIT